MAARVLPPTPAEIALRAKEIRLQWSDREKEKRRAYKTKVVYVPVPDSCFHDSTPHHATAKLTRRLIPLD